MNRICVIGCGGSGKSTFSTELHKITKIPLVHLDTIFWKEGWVEQDRKVFDKQLLTELEKNQWIIDGNFDRTMPLRFKYTDTIFWLDYPTWRCLYRAFKRLFTYYGRWRPDMADGCRESFDWEFLKYVATYRKHKKPLILKIIKEHAKHCKIVTFKNPKQLQNWINKNLC